MNSLALLLVAASVGVDYGWQPTDDGNLEYVIQIEPVLLQTLVDGEEIISEIHPDAKGVRRFRIRIGTGELPRQGVAVEKNEIETKEPATVDKPSAKPPGGSFIDSPINQPPFPPIERPSDLPPVGGSTPALPPIKDNNSFRTDSPPRDVSLRDTFPPHPIPSNPEAEPLTHLRVGHTEETSKPPQTTDTAKHSETAPQAAAKPWLPLVMTVLLLFASVGLNAYLGWIAWGFYRRMQSLTSDLSQSPVGTAS